ncbi:hypothetical protein AZE42_10335 [Rhizopogon vesiculosus]|uniref:Sodium/calcium exchanger membrane region domain-containing protein n=1 Tax=Rhizopogon vesiculosus TaxID=180088 RepID=A0A1J8Q545_9AGAM|nr:hypothetical protein AZE42_10335 [Rhizopogon vesiculosus]
MALQGQAQYDEMTVNDKILKTSHGVALIFLFSYASYLVFQLHSHKALCDDNNEDMQPTKGYEGENPFMLHWRSSRKNMVDSEMVSFPNLIHEGEVDTTTSVSCAEVAMPNVEHGGPKIEAPEQPQMSVALVAITTEFLVDSIDCLTATGLISKEFVGVILLPIVGDAAEHVTAVTSSFKDNLTLSLSVVVGSSTQIALFVIPFIVTLDWIMNKPLTLLFDSLESIVMFLSVINVNYVVQDGKLVGRHDPYVLVLDCGYNFLVSPWYVPRQYHESQSTPSMLLSSPNC